MKQIAKYLYQLTGNVGLSAHPLPLPTTHTGHFIEARIDIQGNPGTLIIIVDPKDPQTKHWIHASTGDAS